MDYLWLIWLIISLVCLVAELSSGDFFITCFAIGALAGMLTALAGLPLWVQVLAWAVCSVLCILFVRPPLVRRLHDKAERHSNADALIGRQATVAEAIPQGGCGYVKIDGDMWRAHTDNGAPVTQGTTVTVAARDSIVLTVVPNS